MVRRRLVARRPRPPIDPASTGRIVRKRNAWTRRRDRGKRPKTPAPKDGWLVAELATLADVPLTTVRYYVQKHLLRPIEFRGTKTRYSRRELLRLLGLLRLKTEGKSTLQEKTRRLDSLGDEELERWLRAGPLPPAAAAALGAQSTVASVVSASAGTSTYREPGRARVEFWQRIALLPGLELMLRSDAPEAARSAAQRICQEYVVSFDNYAA